MSHFDLKQKLKDLIKKAQPHDAIVIVLATLGVMLALGLSLAARVATHAMRPHPVTQNAVPAAATEVVDRHLAWAEEQAAGGLDPQMALVRDFFDAARSRTQAYVDEVLGWDSKFALAKDYVTGNRSHEQFMKERFEAMLFTEGDLQTVVEQAVRTYLRHVDDVESEMLVQLRADLEGMSPDSLPAAVDQAALAATLQAALQEATLNVQGELRGDVGREIVGFIVSEILTVTAAQLATSAGILGTGAATGWASFGTGLIVGFVVDAVVSEIYNQQFNPVGELSAKLNASLNQMESLILQGTPDSAGLRARLDDYSTRRNTVRRQAIQRAVLSPAVF